MKQKKRDTKSIYMSQFGGMLAKKKITPQKKHVYL